MFSPSLMAVTVCAVLAQSSVPPLAGQGVPATPSVPVASQRPHEDLAGGWKYNADLSVNAATGRSETARAANERRGVGAGGGLRRGGGGPGGGNAGGGAGGPAGGGGGAGANPMANLYALVRDTQRDLLEVAPQLRIAVTARDVTIGDDLGRSLTFPTDARKQKYVLGAAMFDAKAYWEASQFKKDIEGPEGLKVSETYFLSEDGDRLFVIIRVGDRAKDAPPVGVNRVYDRVK